MKMIIEKWAVGEQLVGEQALERAKKEGYQLKYVKKGYQLQYVKEQTPEMCLAAVKQNGMALQYKRIKE